MSQISSGWNLSNGTFTFVSHMHNFISGLQKNGDSSKNVNPNELTFSSTGIDDRTLPRSLGDLLKIVPPRYITYAIYVNANGNISKHDCWQYTFLMVENHSQNQADGIVAVARTDWEPDSGGPVKLFGGEIYNYDNQSWYKLYIGPKLLDKLSSGDRTQPGAGSGCAFYPFGGWSEVKISMLLFATVNVRSYCTEGDNLGNNFCFAMMDNYFAGKPGTVESATTEYVREYCTRNVANGDLATASARNQQICACNMRDYSKYNLGNNVSGVRTECFLDDCLRSNFKPGVLNNCPAPECLNLVSIDRSPVTGGNLTIDQRNQCLNILKKYSGDENNGGNNDENDNDVSPVTEQSFWEKNKTIIIVIIAIIVLIIIAATIYFVTAD
jgi:hypothetical protein